MTTLAPEWVRTSDPVIRSPARYRWTTAPAMISTKIPMSNYNRGSISYIVLVYFLQTVRICKNWINLNKHMNLFLAHLIHSKLAVYCAIRQIISK